MHFFIVFGTIQPRHAIFHSRIKAIGSLQVVCHFLKTIGQSPLPCQTFGLALIFCRATTNHQNIKSTMAKLSNVLPETAISPRKPAVVISPKKPFVVIDRRRPLQNNKRGGTRNLRSLPNHTAPKGRRAPVDAQGKDVTVGPQTGAATFQDALEAPHHRRLDSMDQNQAYIMEEVAFLRRKAAVSQPLLLMGSPCLPQSLIPTLVE